MKRMLQLAIAAGIGILLPHTGFCQTGLAGDIHSLQDVLNNLYNQMLPQCSALIGVGRGIAGFAAMWYIAVRVWRHIAHAEPVDFYPLLRPFVIGFAILIFPSVIALINGVMQPTVTGTSAMVNNTDAAVAALLQQKQNAIQQTDQYQWFVGANGNGNEDLWEQYSGDASTGTFSGITNAFRFTMAKMSYNFRNMIKEWMSEVLQVLYQAAALCINTIRTFNLVVLAILGPLVFGISVFDGFHHTLTNWLARYLNVFLWLPVANIFGAIIGNIQVQMLQLDLAQIQARGDTYFSATDAGYLIFMIIGIIGYFTVPTVAGHIVQIGDHGAHLRKITNISTSSVSGAAGAAGGAAGDVMSAAGRGAGNIMSAPGDMAAGYRQGGQSGSFWGRAGAAVGKASQYMQKRLKGD